MASRRWRLSYSFGLVSAAGALFVTGTPAFVQAPFGAGMLNLPNGAGTGRTAQR